MNGAQARTAPTAGPEQWTAAAWAGGGVLALGLLDVVTSYSGGLFSVLALTLGFAVAAALHRSAPAAALAVVWVVALAQLALGVGFTLAQAGALVVAFGCARHGRTATVWLSALSVPAGALVALGTVWSLGYYATGTQVTEAARSLGHSFGDAPVLAVAFVLATAVLAVPWVAGLALRLQERSQEDERQRRLAEQERSVAEDDREQAQEIARLREEQTRLARDVHDVVGHSLAVILAQAESAQFRPDSDSAAIRSTLATIATSARQSLRDVREVLASTDGATAVATTRDGGLDALVDGVRSAGNDVRSSVVGVPRPLPPELEAVAFRVLQEMLTNALKHGARGGVVEVEQHWADHHGEGELRLEVRNLVGVEPAPDETQPLQVAPAGRGLDGMRRRLASVAGHLDVRRREQPDGTATMTATAWVPLRATP